MQPGSHSDRRLSDHSHHNVNDHGLASGMLVAQHHGIWRNVSKDKNEGGLDPDQVEVDFRATGAPVSENSQATARSAATNSPKWVNLNNIHRTIQRRRSRLPDMNVHWIQSVQADCFFAAAIVVHSIVLGVDVESTLKSKSEHSFTGKDLFRPGRLLSIMGMLTLVRGVLLAIFTVELVLRARVLGHKYLFRANGLFDAFLVLSAWVDMMILLSGVPVDGEAERVLHVCGLLRLVRIFRLFAIMPALRSIVTGLASTTVASLWVVALLVLVAYVGSLLCTDLLGEQLPELYGHVLRSVFTHLKLALVEAWPDISDPMMDQSGFWAVYLAIFLLVTNMALLNVVTGIICEKVQSIASGLPPITKEELQVVAKEYQDRLWRLFSLVDSDRSNTLSEAEYMELLKTRDMQKLLQDMDVGLPLDQEHLLTVLDADGNGSLTFEELFNGIRRQQGTRNDHLSQGLQYELAEHDHQIVTGIETAKHALKMSLRHSAAHAHHRLQRRLASSAAKAEHRLWLAATATKASTALSSSVEAKVVETVVRAKVAETAPLPPGPPVKELTKEQVLPKLDDCGLVKELVEQADLPTLEDACEELVGCLRCLRSTAWRAGKEEPTLWASSDFPQKDHWAHSVRLGSDWPAEDRGHLSEKGPIYQEDFNPGCGAATHPQQALGKSSSHSSRTSGCRRGGGESSIGDGNSTGHGGDRPHSSSGSAGGSSSSRRSAHSSGGCSSRASSHSNKSGERPDGSPTFGSLPAGGAWSRSDVQTLRVHVLGLHGLHTGGVPFSGSFDACVVLRFGPLECRTATAQYSAGAAWHFGGTLSFDLQLLHDYDGPVVLEAEVMNTWLYTDDSIGKTLVDLRSLTPDNWHRQGRQLDGRHSGSLELAIRLEKAENVDKVAQEGGDIGADGKLTTKRPRNGLYAAWSFGVPSGSVAEHDLLAASSLPSDHCSELEAQPRVRHKPVVRYTLGGETGRSSGSSCGSPNSTAFPGLERDAEPATSDHPGTNLGAHCNSSGSGIAVDATEGASSAPPMHMMSPAAEADSVDAQGSKGNAEFLGTNEPVAEAPMMPVA